MKSIIVDDELKNIGILKKMLLEFCPSVNVVGEASNMNQAFDLINKLHPELVFLDIEMPYGNAFDLLDKLMPIGFEIIFVTAFNEYALKAFKYSALDYLLKPVSISELRLAVAKAEKRFGSIETNTQVGNLLNNMKDNSDPLKKIALPFKDGLVFVVVKDIIRCEASGAYTYIFTRENGRIISSKNIKEFEVLLPSQIFFRVHHSHIINLNEISKYNRGRGGFVEMKDGAIIDVAVRRKDDFLSRF